MSERILFVEDEKFVLETFRRNLRMNFEVETALGPFAALDLLEATGPCAVVVSDLKMPAMDGVELLGIIKSRWPDTVRIMLTGHAELATAISAVNKGAIFRFLTKPCAPDELVAAVNDGLRQYRLVMAERQLLHGTLRGCIQVLSELLALVSPQAFGRSEKAKTLVAEMVQSLGLENGWKYELAAMLSHVGCISLPRDVLERKVSGLPLSAQDEEIFRMHPKIAGNLLRNIPRLEGIVEMVSEQEAPLSANPCLGARMLKACLDFTDLEGAGASLDDVLTRMTTAVSVYDGRVVAILKEVVQRRQGGEVRNVALSDLREGMVLVDPLLSSKGTVIMDKGQPITPAALERFRNFGTILGIREPICVSVKEGACG